MQQGLDTNSGFDKANFDIFDNKEFVKSLYNKAQTFIGMTTENVDFDSLGEYVAYRYDMEIPKVEKEKTDFCDIED